ncbi:hypothetical protein SELMODRAFT_422254 [Selaginella moellendorffii]|uniref:Uncharacterized protein n=1 Tax=Selaginella moellendorffii TaxID=88036 RepID=D8SHV7_SELML|nr:hypothetical protein SELMODRAFT_422254 [Selaginella moellendorffii]
MAGKMVLVLVAITVVGSMITANASYFDAWAGPGCNNRLERYSACGCTNVGASRARLLRPTTWQTAKVWRRHGLVPLYGTARALDGTASSSSAKELHGTQIARAFNRLNWQRPFHTTPASPNYTLIQNYSDFET